MKSIGNGWKRAQEAQQRKKDAERVRGYWAGNAQTTLTYFQPVEEQWKQNANASRSTLTEDPSNWTTWQRIKRALRTL